MSCSVKESFSFWRVFFKSWPVFSGSHICTGPPYITTDPFWALFWRTEQVEAVPFNSYYLLGRVFTAKLLEK